MVGTSGGLSEGEGGVELNMVNHTLFGLKEQGCRERVREISVLLFLCIFSCVGIFLISDLNPF